MIEVIDVMMADSYDYSDLGIILVGTFNNHGYPEGFELTDKIGNQIPRWFKKEPVLEIPSDVTQGVYIRGMYSERLSKSRLAAYMKGRRG